MIRRPFILLAVVCVVLAAGVAGSLAWSWRTLNAPLALPEDGVLYQVPSGAALSNVTAALEAMGIVRHPRLIDWYARWRGTATAIQAGEYRIAPGQTGIGLLAQLERGEVYLHQFTIVEGWRFADVLQRLREHPAVAVSEYTAEEVMAQLGRPDEHPEGQFLPDTYSFPRGTTEIELLRIANRALWELLDRNWSQRTHDDVLESPYQGLILASIIEKETALDSERTLMSGVFYERLRRGMRLQADPTVIYGLGDAYQGNLTRAHLTGDSPYNTYTRAGLPPTPIAMAGRASIAAAFAPVDSGALYFVATGEPDGSHVFSRTLEEHNAAVRRFLARARNGN